MSTFGNLEIGKTGINAAQLGQTTTGHNIANVNTEGYSRQRVEQSADSNRYDGKQQGVKIDDIARLHDVFNAEKIVEQKSLLEDWSTRLKYLQNLESIFQDREGKGVLEGLTAFWNAWSGAATQPESLAERSNLISVSSQLADKFDKLDKRLLSIQQGMSNDLQNNMMTLNTLSQEVANLNKQIQRLEALQANANDLKDKRDQAILKMSQVANINWFYNKQNQIDVQLAAGVPLVRHTSAYDVVPFNNTIDPALPRIGYKLASGKLLDVSEQIKGGVLKAIIATRDSVIGRQRENLRYLSQNLAEQVNRLHAPGSGLGKSFNELTAKVALNNNLIDQPLSGIEDGRLHFQLVPNAKTQDAQEIVIEINAASDTLATIVDKINTAARAISPASEIIVDEDQGVDPNKDNLIQASIDSDNRFHLNAGPGYSFLFSEDSSGLLSRLGLNPFFLMDQPSGLLQVNPDLQQSPADIALGYDLNPGDNRIALAIHDLQFTKILNNNTATFDEFYRNMYTEVGSETQSAIKNQNNHQNIYDQYLALKDSITGVNIDEEMANMVKYQKAYDASAKYISTVDSMTETLINM